MSSIVTPAGAPKTDADARTVAAAKPLSPNQRAWARFRRNRIGHVSLWIFLAMLVTATFAEIVSNDRPFVARIGGQWHAPMFANPSERAIGGDFDTGTDWKDPFVAERAGAAGQLGAVHGQHALRHLDGLLLARSLAVAADGKQLDRHGPAWPRHGRPAALRLSRQHLVRARAHGRRHADRHPGRRAAGLLRRAGRPLPAALRRGVGRGARAVPADHLRQHLRAVAAAAAGAAVAVGLDGAVGLRARGVPAQPEPRVREGGAGAGPVEPPDHLAARAAELDDARDHLPAVPDERGHPRPDVAGLPGPGRAAEHSVASANCSSRARTISTRGGSSCRPSCCWWSRCCC